MRQIHPKTATSLRRSRPHLIQPYLDRPHSPSQRHPDPLSRFITIHFAAPPLDLAGISTEFCRTISTQFCFTYSLGGVTAMLRGLHARLCHAFPVTVQTTQNRFVVVIPSSSLLASSATATVYRRGACVRLIHTAHPCADVHCSVCGLL